MSKDEKWLEEVDYHLAKVMQSAAKELAENAVVLRNLDLAEATDICMKHVWWFLGTLAHELESAGEDELDCLYGPLHEGVTKSVERSYGYVPW